MAAKKARKASAKKTPKKPSRQSPKKVAQDTRRSVSEAKIEKRFEDFGKEMEAWGDRFGKRMERKGDEWDSWFHRSFGLIGPLISSMFGIIIFALFMWLIGFINGLVNSTFLSGIQGFMADNMAAFFLIFLYFSYTSYMSRASPKGYDPISPLFSAIGVTIGFWVVAEVLAIANASLGLVIIFNVITLINTNLFWIFAAFLMIGYAFWGIKRAAGCPYCDWEKDKWCPECSHKEMEMRRKSLGSKRKTAKPAMVSRASPPDEKVRRLYRSGNDKILGGVCGGIAAYLGVDPVLVRLLWVIGTLAWGFGLLAYIIAWIIIPRNPRHKWD